MNPRHSWGLGAALLVLLSSLAAAAPAARPDPANPAAAVPALRYSSPFHNYRSHREQELGSWRAANDEVARIGGWRAYAREAAAPAPAPAASSASAPASRAGHQHH